MFDNLNITNIEIEMSASCSQTIQVAYVKFYARLTGDNNTEHMSDEYKLSHYFENG